MISNLFYYIVLPLVLTVSLEGYAAILVGYNTVNDQKKIGLVNLITNPIANIINLTVITFVAVLSNNWFLYILFLLLSEVIIIFIEAKLFQRFLGVHKKEAYDLSLILNISSFVIGSAILALLR